MNPALALTIMHTATLAAPAIIPQPLRLETKPGSFTIDAATRIEAGAAAKAVADQFRREIQPAIGYELPNRKASDNVVRFILDRKLMNLGAEGYQLNVQPDRIEIKSSNPAGLYYGAQSLRQLLPTAVYRKAPVTGVAWTIPCVQIEDSPRFSWRGMHLDVGRHFMPKEFVLKFIDLLAMHKMNRFHWHLTEDQGWRIEIKKYPKLTSVGAWRKDDMLTYEPATYTGKPHGGFYTQDDIREVVAYASQRFITIVPEIEMPGHSRAAVAAYPELGNTGVPIEVGTKWGVEQDVFNVEDSTIDFLKNVLTEVMGLFPGEFIHIGGDECPKAQWKASPKAQAKMKALALKDEDELQSWFIRQIDTFLDEHKRRLVGWDEILEGGLATGATVMSWRGTAGGIAAAKAGHDVVMTPGSHTYFDHYQSDKRDREPHAIGGFTNLERAYSYEPIPEELNAKQAKHVLGSQGQLWTEYMPNAKHVEYMAFPRACAMSEITWSPGAKRDFADFKIRLKTHLERLNALDVNFRHPGD